MANLRKLINEISYDYEKTLLKNPKKEEVWELVKNSELQGNLEKYKVVRWVVKGKDLFVANAEEYTHRRIFIIMGIDTIKDTSKYDYGITTYKKGSKPIVQSLYKREINKKDQWIKKVFEIGSIDESLQFVKFTYDNYKEDKHPKVKVLDFKYKGQVGQKTYGKRDDLLGWNLNYFSNKKYAQKAIDDIDSFARMLGANSGKEKYDRIKYFFPEQAKLIRRYMRKHIKNIKYKLGKFFWKQTNFDDLIKFDKNSF